MEKECAHVPCRCKADPGSDYCSPQCERSLGKTDCECGHPECGAMGVKGAYVDAKDQI
ncbi:MAG TPA: hypothetical protein VMM38_04645 [Aridibacter sp.]|nr:hypothetical protein [Aridibacter sp.]